MNALGNLTAKLNKSVAHGWIAAVAAVKLCLVAVATAVAILQLASAAANAAEDKPLISAARVAGDQDRTRIVLEVDQQLTPTISALGSPYRLILDLPEVTFGFLSSSNPAGKGLVSDWRFGLFAVGKSRVVVDLAAPARVDKTLFLPSVDDQPSRLVIDLVRASEQEFADFVTASRPSRTATKKAAPKADRLSAERAKDKPVIVLDPGHGGIDNGAIGVAGTLEKAIVLEFTKLLRDKLAEGDRYDIHLTREDDTFIPLGDRVQVGHDLAADLFISIHADSVRRGQKFARGATVYTLSNKASDRLAEELATTENMSDVIAGVELDEEPTEVTDILLDLARRETRSFSVYFAKTLVDELQSAVRLINNPHRSAGFRVLKAHDVPSVLVELGYLSNAHDEKLLISEEWRERMASAMAEAIHGFFRPRLAGRKAAPSQ
ncbi:N-acetylmuramoyl-L-alanine amidase [Labrenzia sp. PHM005]|nr:N-acetylmuramoyl-L-alanine amidase [Labrenzia sp. PHM005]